MIPAQAAVQARHLHADGWTVSAIARHLGHDRKTVRIYLAGVRDPGQPRAGTTDTFGPFDAYATRRLRQDPHLSAAALHRELLGLDYAGSYPPLCWPTCRPGSASSTAPTTTSTPAKARELTDPTPTPSPRSPATTRTPWPRRCRPSPAGTGTRRRR